VAPITVSDYIFNKLSSVGVGHVFTVTGGGAMFLNDAAHRNKKIEVVCNHHEQASSMAAVAYSKYKNDYAAVMVTTGCGSTNTITGLLEAWQDNLPVVFVSGQVNHHQTSKKFNLGLRQVGVQESDIISVVSSMTKYAKMITNPDDIRYELEKALYLAKSGRPGPVWIDVPLDIQGSEIDQKSLKSYTEESNTNSVDLGEFEKQLNKSQRPVVLAGNGVRLSSASKELEQFIKDKNIPMVNTFLGVDLVDNNDSLNIGRVGVKGTRAANFAMQNCDMLIVIGCRLSVATTGYIYDFFAREAKVFVIDIDENEHKKDTVKIDSFIKSDAKHFLIQANKLNYTSKKDWSSKCYEWKQKWHSLSDHDISDTNGISMYYFIDQLSENNKNDSAVVSDAGSAYYIASQALKTTKEQRYITSGAQADMGFTIPACIGVSNANKQIDVIGITGDGSFQTNIQELQTIKHHSYPIKIFVLNNHGYLSIRTTQRKFFNDRFVGTCKNSGVSFPKTEDICKAYGIKYFCFKTNQELQNGIKKVLNEKQPVVCEVICKEWDQVLPTISSKKTKEGKMVSKPLEDMFPFLTREEFNDNMVIEPLLEE
jgi:acetolactate synthase-1/2/3 large subunit